jgi:hypothetical protein
MVVMEASLAQDTIQGPSSDSGETRPMPLPLPVAHRIVGPLGAGCRPTGRLCALHHASPANDARAKGRGRRSSLARSRLRPVGAHTGAGSTRAEPGHFRKSLIERL